MKVDLILGYNIDHNHFGRWFETIDELNEGGLAMKPSEYARKMSTGQFLASCINDLRNIEISK